MLQGGKTELGSHSFAAKTKPEKFKNFNESSKFLTQMEILELLWPCLPREIVWIRHYFTTLLYTYKYIALPQKMWTWTCG